MPEESTNLLQIVRIPGQHLRTFVDRLQRISATLPVDDEDQQVITEILPRLQVCSFMAENLHTTRSEDLSARYGTRTLPLQPLSRYVRRRMLKGSPWDVECFHEDDAEVQCARQGLEHCVFQDATHRQCTSDPICVDSAVF